MPLPRAVAARYEAAHDGQLARADRAGDQAERAVRRAWDRIVALLRSKPWPLEAKRRGTAIAAELLATVQAELRAAFGTIARQGHAEAAQALAQHADLRVLRAAADRRGLTEARLLEDDLAPRTFVGTIALGREPVVIGDMTAAEQREALARLLFPAPAEAQIAGWLNATVNGTTWTAALQRSALAAGATPDALAGLIAGGFAAGKTIPQIAQDLAPAVQQVGSAATRIARTWGMAVAHEATDAAQAELEDEIVGWQIHAQRDIHTRTWHLSRDGTIYYKRPVGDQKGLPQMPRPPLEAEDPAERPGDAPQIAYNCRCWRSPVFRT